MAAFSDLTPRDREILLAIHKNRFLAFRQIQEVFFPDGHHAPVSRRMKKLVERGYLGEWEKLVATGGRPKYFFIARGPGARAVRQLIIEERIAAAHALGRDISPDQADPGPITPAQLVAGKNPLDIEHATEVADLWVLFRKATAAPDTPEMALWEVERRGRGPVSAERGFRPPNYDYRLVLKYSNDYKLFFGEHDRAHEPLRRFRKQKIQAYTALLRSGRCRGLYGASTFQVLVSVQGDDRTAAKRAVQLARMVVETVGEEMTGLFLFGFFSRLHAENVLPEAGRWVEPRSIFK